MQLPLIIASLLSLTSAAAINTARAAPCDIQQTPLCCEAPIKGGWGSGCKEPTEAVETTNELLMYCDRLRSYPACCMMSALADYWLGCTEV